MTRAYNFAAGPATLPLEVLEQAREELLEWQGTGCSVMEVSHRGKEFEACNAEAEQDLRDLLGIPSNYRVLFLQGGASMQWSQILFNLCGSNPHGDFILTGEWTTRAVAEAQRLLPLWGGSVNVVASSADRNFSYIPDESTWQRRKDACFMHVCTNETIQGVEYNFVPEQLGDVTLVADMSSHIVSRPVDVARYGLIYAGAQKNIGPAGVTIVIVRDDLLGKCRADTPRMFDYKLMADNHSLLNTPPTFGIYLAGLVFKWLKRQGGVEAIERKNIAKAELLYGYLDSQDFYYSPVAKRDRSRMNAPFRLKDESLNAKFLAETQAAGLVALKGHKAVGGMRASIYNAMPIEGVQALVGFMRDFAARNG
ncbi:3-phosphoserine/phosphohydroxythreonine transaminase [Derxia lacustris]|uniref:3-phosphoserine/phosphohydroxythreonine transaminase n=1 Tax=Derxia lacustris TaxID=764842 RepID=UPI000A172259|nr:3-phosphoserine/phosphohydroxythreonine transaminase [Derxia lacustris]